MTKEELAKWLHDNYEAIAKEQNWNTQQICKVEFDTLPDANKRTMIEMADRILNFNLLRLHFDEILQTQGEVQMMQRDWWQLYKRGWKKHRDFWNRRWWIRFKWDPKYNVS